MHTTGSMYLWIWPMQQLPKWKPRIGKSLSLRMHSIKVNLTCRMMIHMSNASESRYLDQVRELGHLRAAIMQGETETTYEAINVRVSLGGVDDMLFQYADLVEFPGFNHGKAQAFVWHAI